MKKKAKKEAKWKQIAWDGNPELKLRCWRKKFGSGHVSVGIGSFQIVCYSYGPDSDDSISGTRWRKDRIVSEKEMMALVDKNKGKHNNYS